MEIQTLEKLIETQRKIVVENDKQERSFIETLNAEILETVKNVTGVLDVEINFERGRTVIMFKREDNSNWTWDVQINTYENRAIYDNEETKLEIKTEWSGRNADTDRELKYAVLIGKVAEDMLGEKIILNKILWARDKHYNFAKDIAAGDARSTLWQLERELTEAQKKAKTDAADAQINEGTIFVGKKYWQRGRNFRVNTSKFVRIKKLGRKNITLEVGYEREIDGVNQIWWDEWNKTYISRSDLQWHIAEGYIEKNA